MDNNQIEREECVVHYIRRSFIACIGCRAHRNDRIKESVLSFGWIYFYGFISRK